MVIKAVAIIDWTIGFEKKRGEKRLIIRNTFSRCNVKKCFVFMYLNCSFILSFCFFVFSSPGV